MQEESLQVLNSRENSFDPVPRRYYDLTEKVREKQKTLFSLQEERAELRRKKEPTPRTFVNNFGEATKREITSASYERAQKRLDKQIWGRFKGR